MKVLGGLAEAEADHALIAWSRHTPPGVELGRPLLAQPDDGAVLLATTVAWWWIEDSEALRLLPLAGGQAELTVFHDGEEVSRTIGSVG